MTYKEFGLGWLLEEKKITFWERIKYMRTTNLIFLDHLCYSFIWVIVSTLESFWTIQSTLYLTMLWFFIAVTFFYDFEMY